MATSRARDPRRQGASIAVELAWGQPWGVTVVMIPDGKEILANLASRRVRFQALDRARVEAVRMCRAAGLECEDFHALLVPASDG